MNTDLKLPVASLLAILTVAACSSAPEPSRDPYNPADSQRDRAHQAQDELSSETK